jgi:hypothetical protein
MSQKVDTLCGLLMRPKIPDGNRPMGIIDPSAPRKSLSIGRLGC